MRRGLELAVLLVARLPSAALLHDAAANITAGHGCTPAVRAPLRGRVVRSSLTGGLNYGPRGSSTWTPSRRVGLK